MVSSVSNYPGSDVLITLGGEGPTGRPVRHFCHGPGDRGGRPEPRQRLWGWRGVGGFEGPKKWDLLDW